MTAINQLWLKYYNNRIYSTITRQQSTNHMLWNDTIEYCRIMRRKKYWISKGGGLNEFVHEKSKRCSVELVWLKYILHKLVSQDAYVYVWNAHLFNIPPKRLSVPLLLNNRISRNIVENTAYILFSQEFWLNFGEIPLLNWNCCPMSSCFLSLQLFKTTYGISLSSVDYEYILHMYIYLEVYLHAARKF